MNGWEVMGFCLSVGVSAGAFVWATWRCRKNEDEEMPK